jgi:beta-glucanase (GH16 family)
MRRAFFVAFAVALVLTTSGAARAQVGNLIWEDNFNDLNSWLKITGNGSWGWGNGELEFYKNENVDVADVPGEPGNKALRIIARQESGPGIVDQWGNPLLYTSGKVMSKSFVSVKYGMIETRVWIPNLDLGGFPAVWMLGTANYAWPACGEIDMMEMGLKKAFRDLHDTHNGGNGLNNSTVNQMTAGNAIFYSDGAVTPENPSGAASLSWDPDDDYARPYYNYANPLVGRFLTYRLYWDEDSLRQTVIDGGVERDFFTEPFAIGPDALEFREPFYLIANLAIGGAVTDAYQLGAPASGAPVTMPFPATMYVDYVRVYQWKGQGEVHLGPPVARGGTFGILTDTTPTNAALLTDSTSKIYIWANTMVPGTIAPYEGANGLSWRSNGQGWFGGGIMSIQPLNLYSFGDGHLKFRIKIPANVTFKIGVIDSWNNQFYVSFPAGQTRYGLVRNGEWGQASIPVSDLRGLAIDLRMLSYPFVILEEQGIACEFAVDDIYWDGGGPVTAVAPGTGRGAATLLASAPNPFTTATDLRFQLAAEGPYELEVYDVAGKRVARFQGVGRAGPNAVRWNGRDDQGHTTRAGIYYYRLVSGGQSASRKVVRLE